MLGLKLKKREKAVDKEKLAYYLTEEKNESTDTVEKDENTNAEVVQNALTTEVESTEVAKTSAEIVPADEPLIGIKFQSDTSKVAKEMSDFSRIAEILGKDELTVIEECKLYQIQNIMSHVEKAVVRYGLTEGEARGIINDALTVGYGGVAISPAYLTTLAENFKDGEEVKVSAVIDFPFGTSSFKVKHAEMKNAVKLGVDEIMVVFPAQLLKNEKESIKELKKEMKKIRRVGKLDKGVAVNAEDVDGEDIKRFMHLAEKRKMKYIAFLFGNVTAKELCDKMSEIVSYKNKTAIKVMANVEDVQGVKTLIEQKADGIITPFADKIARELFAEFKITIAKLY